MLSLRGGSPHGALSPPLEEGGEVNRGVGELKQLGALFVAALARQEENSVPAWQKLLNYLESDLQQDRLKQISQHPETQHYIKRAIKHAQKYSERLEHVGIVNRLAKLFPEAVKQLQQEELPYSYSYSDVKENASKKPRHKRAATTEPEKPTEGSIYSYTPSNLAATFRGPSVRLNDLSSAASKVSEEVSVVERDLLHNVLLIPKTRHSVHTDRDLLPLSGYKRSHHRSRSTPGYATYFNEEHLSSYEKPLLDPLLSSEIKDEHFSKSDRNTLFPKKQLRSPRKSIKEGCLGSPSSNMKNAYDVIEAFASGQLKSESESVYFNYTNRSKWNPYDLTIVSKTKVNPEHFVISKFGVLRVYPNETSDFQSFADWLREAGLYTILRKIPFLKHYLVKKAFRQWYRNVRFAQFARIHARVSQVSIRFLPDFANALLKIQNLSEELLTVPFHHLTALSCYSQESFEHSLQGSQSKAQRFLQKYFKYCRRIVTGVIKSSQSRVLELETEKRHKPFVSDLPLSVQKEKHLKLERDLKAAVYQESSLADFVCLAEHILYSCLLKLARQEAQSWSKTALALDEQLISASREATNTPVYSSVVSTPVSRNVSSPQGNQPAPSSPDAHLVAFLCASFSFDESGVLSIRPPESELKTIMFGPLEKILSVLSSAVKPLTSPETHQGRPTSRSSVNVSPSPGKPQTNSRPAINPQDMLASSRPVPPSMAPSKQPKSLLTVLKGIALSQDKLSSEKEQDNLVLQSDRAKSQLSQVTGTTGDELRAGQAHKVSGLAQERSPLETVKFIKRIEQDEVYLSSLRSMETAVECVCSEMSSMCAEYSWLNDVWGFVTHWEGKRRAMNMTADEYEVVLTQLYEWLQLFNLLPSQLLTSHSLLSVSTSDIVGRVYPQLTAILDQVTSTGIQQAMTLCEKVLEEIKQRAEVLSSKRYDLEGFAEYAHQLRECQLFDKSEAANIDYILRVHSALLRHGVEVPEEDKALGKKLQQSWFEFEEKLKDAEEVVATQTPVKAQGLQKSIKSYEEELSNLVSQVNRGKFIDPAGIPNELLEELKQIQEEVFAVRSRLLGLSKWKEAITGKPHDLSGITSLLEQQFIRQELWKYRRAFDTYEKEWTKASFKKLDTSLISQKVTDWLKACDKLEGTLPPDDPVLIAWRNRLEEFKQRIPLLQQLASKALRTSHWYTIFASLGEDYNPGQPYTLTDFDLYKIYDHSNIIFEICHDAMQEDKLRAKVNELQTCLEQKTISITQFPIDRYPFAAPVQPDESSFKPEVTPRHTNTPQAKKTSVGPRFNTQPTIGPATPAKTTSFAVGFQRAVRGSTTLDCLFSIENDSNLCMWLENDVIQTKVLLSSPHLGSLKMRGELLLKTLGELQEIVTVLSQCQAKWLQLLSLFSHMDAPSRESEGLKELQQATTKFQEIALSIRDDPRLLSILEKRRGQKGFRELQGDQLRHYIQEVDSGLESVVYKVQGHLKESCSQFPRLCYLSDKEVLRVMSHNGQPMAIMPLITRVFPSIKSLQCTEIISNQSSVSFRKPKSDIEEGLQLIAVDGWHGEQLSLAVPLPLGKRTAPHWLNALEGALSYSLSTALTDCIASLPDSLLGTGGNDQSNSGVIRWVRNNLSQCVQLSLELSWTSVLHAALSSDNATKQLKQTSTRLHNTVRLVVNVVKSLRSELAKEGSSKWKRSSLLTLNNIVLILEHKLEIIKSILNNTGISPGCFSWRSHILYSSEVDNLYEEPMSDHENVNKKGAFNAQTSTSSLPLSVSSSTLNHTTIPGRPSMVQRLHASPHSLVSSSKSLLASRNNFSTNPATVNELPRSGSSSFVFSTEIATSRRQQIPTKCMIHCGESISAYGFEYLGPEHRLVLTPASEACLLSVANTLAHFSFPALCGGPGSGKSETAKEVSKVLGRHHYQFHCSPVTLLSNLHHLLTGAMQSGSLLLLENFLSLRPQVRILFGEWLQALNLIFAKAFKGKQSSIILTQPQESHSETALTGVESMSTLPSSPLSDEHQQRMITTDPSSQTLNSQTPSNKTLLSQKCSKQSALTVDNPLSERASSSLSQQHTSSHLLLQGNSSVHLMASSIKGVSPFPSRQIDSPSQHSNVQRSISGRTSRATTRIDWYKIADGDDPINQEWFGYGGGPKVELEFNGDLFRVNPAFGCCLIDMACIDEMVEVPDQLKVALRTVSVKLPDLAYIAEVLLLSHGFNDAYILSRSLAKFWEHFSCQVSSSSDGPQSMTVDTHSMKLVINQAAILVGTASQISTESESTAIVQAIEQCFYRQLTQPIETEQREEYGETVSSTYDISNWNKLHQLLEIYFPNSGMNMGEKELIPAELAEAIQSQLADQHLQTLPSFVNKVKQLHVSLQHSKCVIFSGPSGSGKTMAYNTLAAAYQYIRELRALGKSSKTVKTSNRYTTVESEGCREEYPITDITVINPGAYSFEELFGTYHIVPNESNTGHGQWKDGILTRILRQIMSFEESDYTVHQSDNTKQELLDNESILHWVVLDGPVDSTLMEALGPLVSGEGLFLSNGEKLCLSSSCQILVETSVLSEMTPSLLSHSALLHFSSGVVPFDAVVDTWLDRAPTQHNLSPLSTETLATMIKQLLPETLEFLQETNTKCLCTPYTLWAKSQTYGMTETQCFLNLLSAVLERNAPKVESSITHTGMTSRSSRMSSRGMMESGTSSAMLTSYSSSSVQFDRSISVTSSRMSVMHTDGEQLDPITDKDNLVDDDLSECNLDIEFGLSMQLQMASMLSFAYIWSLGAFSPFSELSTFSDFARDLIMQLPYAVPLPEEGSVFDYYLNLRQYQFLPWADRKGNSGGDISSSGYVSLPELERYSYIIDLYLTYGFNVMIVGQRGTGKTSLVTNLLQSRLPITRLQITSAISPSQLQEKFLTKINAIEKRGGQRHTRGGRKTSNKCVFFLDDVHLASKGAVNNSSTLPSSRSFSKTSAVLELTRFASIHHQLYDYSRNYQHTLNNVRFISSCTPEEYLKLPIEFSRAFNPVPFIPPSDDCLKNIFSRSVLVWVQQFPESSMGDPEVFAEALGTASVTVIRSLTGKIHPSPSTPHLNFTLHDVMHIYEGLLLLSPDTKTQSQPHFSLFNRRGFLSSSQSGRISRKKSSGKQKASRLKHLPSLGASTSKAQVKTRKRSNALIGGQPEQAEAVSTLRMIIRLWCHETTRIYLDRVVDSKDRIWFTKLLEVCIKYCFCGDNLQSTTKTLTQQRQLGGTASYGGRRMRGGKMPQSSSSEGPSLEDLAKSGIKVDVLQRLMPADRDEEGDGSLRKFIALDQVTMKGEDLTGLIFAQFPSVSTSSLTPVESVPPSPSVSSDKIDQDTDVSTATYSELGDGQVMDLLAKHMETFKKLTSEGVQSTFNLVLFKGAIEHASRICRVLNLPGSHALLIGTKGSGRTTLVRLMSQIFKAKLFELGYNSENGPSHESVQTTLKNVCISAAVDSTHTVLLITSKDNLGTQAWENVCQIMEEGLCPGLFTTSELLVMSNKLQRGRVKKTTEGARQTFAKAVCKNLHVFIIWDVHYRTGSLFSTDSVLDQPHNPVSMVVSGNKYLSKQSFDHGTSGDDDIDRLQRSIPPTCPMFSKEETLRATFRSLCRACSYIDHYQSWSKQAYTDIALRWWQQGWGDTDYNSVKWQDWIDTSSQLEAVGMLATHVHLTTTEVLNREYGPHASKLVSPKVFIECLRMAQELAVKLKTKEMVVADRLQSSLKKLEDVDNIVCELEKNLATLRPELTTAEQEVQQRMNQITTAKEKYMAANQKCKDADGTIKIESKNVEHLTKVVEENFNEVSPVYRSALHALSSVEKNDVLELMGYRHPPAILTPVFDALCMLFDREQTWEDCKQLLLSPNFFVSLRFFDKDNVPKRKLQRLERMIDKSSKFELLGHGSQAVVSLCMWLNALVDYHHAKMAVQPFREQLAEAEKTLMDANKTYVEMRRDMMATKTDLESTVKLHKESVQSQRTIEAKVEGVCSKLDHARHLLATMAKQRHKWEEKVKLTRSRIDSLPGHALLCSAAVCYLTRVPPSKHKALLSAWLGYCEGTISLGNVIEERGGLQAAQGYQTRSGQQQVVRIQKDFTISAHLSEQEEQATWEQESVFPDQATQDRCLASRSTCTLDSAFWPLLFDPHGHFEYYVNAMGYSDVNVAAHNPDAQEKGASVVRKHSSAKKECALVLRIDTSDSYFIENLKEGLTSGSTVLLSFNIDSYSLLNKQAKKLLSKLLKRDFALDSRSQMRLSLNQFQHITVHPDFKLYIVVEQSLEDATTFKGDGLLSMSGCELSSFFVVDLGLSTCGLQNYFQKLILKHKRPEYSVRYKSLLADLTLHQQQLKDNEEKIVNCAVDTPGSMLDLSNLCETVQLSESSDSSTMELILETKKNLRVFDQQVQVYRPLSEHASMLFNCVQKLAKYFKYFRFSLEWFEALVSEVLTGSGRDIKVPDNLMAINAHVLHLKHKVLSKVYEALQIHLFERHQVLLLLLFGLEIMKHQGKLSFEEDNLFGESLHTTEIHLQLISPDGNAPSRTQNDPQKPYWISDESWCGVLQLQKCLLSFRRLSLEVNNFCNEWMEYFQMTPSLLSPVPGYGDSCSIGQKLLLWKVFKQDMFTEVAKDFVLHMFGAQFIRTHPNTISSILPHTKPSVPVLCYCSNTHTFAPCLKLAASQRDIEVHSIALIDKSHLDDLLSQLPDLVQEGRWLIIEHCHMCSESPDMLESIAKELLTISASADTHREFQVWVPLPLEFYISVHLHNGFLNVAFEEQVDVVQRHNYVISSAKSQTLLQDLQEVVKHSSSNYVKPTTIQWGNHESVVSKLCDFIPKPLSPSEISNLDPKQEFTQSIPSLLFEELCAHNGIVVSIQSSLKTLSNFLIGDLPFSASYGNILSSVNRGLLPVEWGNLLLEQHGFPQELIPALKLLRQRFSFYVSTLQSGTVPSHFSPLIVSNPKDFISRTVHFFAAECQLNACDVTVEAIVTNAEGHLEGHQDLLQPSLTFKNLFLHGATLNKQGQLLAVSKECGNEKPKTPCSVAIHLNMIDSENIVQKDQAIRCGGSKSTSSEFVYDCPIVLHSSSSNNMVTLFRIQLTNCHRSLKENTNIYLSCAY